ncbi:hypothetical protein B0H16DRAFT_153966 [Mycena metata]|uniref:Uncharacterized protein n=1 Tax=Mycena metata TaxID=1033252 RepID=A0AAD7MVM7_9AGAR|nr:hypothetical protein B0H16DRAFT_153966 [Mycena metata]
MQPANHRHQISTTRTRTRTGTAADITSPAIGSPFRASGRGVDLTMLALWWSSGLAPSGRCACVYRPARALLDWREFGVDDFWAGRWSGCGDDLVIDTEDSHGFTLVPPRKWGVWTLAPRVCFVLVANRRLEIALSIEGDLEFGARRSASALCVGVGPSGRAFVCFWDDVRDLRSCVGGDSSFPFSAGRRAAGYFVLAGRCTWGFSLPAGC